MKLKKSCIKIAAWMTLMAFCSQTLFAQSLPQTQPVFSSSEVRVFPDRSLLPAGMGKVNEIWGSASPSVFLIQDPHGQEEGQKNIRQMLEFIHSKNNFETLLIEGGIGQQDPALLDWFTEKKWNDKAAAFLLYEGHIGGPELFLKDHRQVRAEGLEALEPYIRNLELFQSVIRERKATSSFLRDALLNLKTKASRSMTPALYAFFKMWLSYENGESSFPVFLEQLENSAKETLELDLKEPWFQLQWPMMVRYTELKRRQSLLNPQAAAEDRAKLEAWALKNLGRKLEAEFQDRRRFWELFYEEASLKGFDFRDYPALMLQEGFEILQTEMDAALFFEEWEHLRDKVLGALVKDEKAESPLLEEARSLLFLKKLFELELTPEEFRTAEQGSAAQFLKTAPESVRVQYQNSMNFYRTALDRDAIMARTIAEHAKQSSKPVVAIAGGFHTPGLTQFLKDQNLSYALLSPHLPEIQPQDAYQAAMLGEVRPLDLAQFTNRVPSEITPPKNWQGRLPQSISSGRAQLRRAYELSASAHGAITASRAETREDNEPVLMQRSEDRDGLAVLLEDMTGFLKFYQEAEAIENPGLLKTQVKRYSERLQTLKKNQDAEVQRLSSLVNILETILKVVELIYEANEKAGQIYGGVEGVLAKAIADWTENYVVGSSPEDIQKSNARLLFMKESFKALLARSARGFAKADEMLSRTSLSRSSLKIAEGQEKLSEIPNFDGFNSSLIAERLGHLIFVFREAQDLTYLDQVHLILSAQSGFLDALKAQISPRAESREEFDALLKDMQAFLAFYRGNEVIENPGLLITQVNRYYERAEELLAKTPESQQLLRALMTSVAALARMIIFIYDGHQLVGKLLEPLEVKLSQNIQSWVQNFIVGSDPEEIRIADETLGRIKTEFRLLFERRKQPLIQSPLTFARSIRSLTEGEQRLFQIPSYNGFNHGAIAEQLEALIPYFRETSDLAYLDQVYTALSQQQNLLESIQSVLQRSETRNLTVVEMNEATINEWLTLARVSVKDFHRTPQGLHLGTQITQFMELIGAFPRPDAPPFKVFDAGSGQGFFAFRLSLERLNASVFGVEGDKMLHSDSLKVLEEAERSGQIAKEQIQFAHGDFNDPQFADKIREADIVYYYESGSKDEASFRKTLLKDMKPGSRLIVLSSMTGSSFIKPLLETGLFTEITDSVMPGSVWVHVLERSEAREEMEPLERRSFRQIITEDFPINLNSNDLSDIDEVSLAESLRPLLDHMERLTPMSSLVNYNILSLAFWNNLLSGVMIEGLLLLLMLPPVAAGLTMSLGAFVQKEKIPAFMRNLHRYRALRAEQNKLYGFRPDSSKSESENNKLRLSVIHRVWQNLFHPDTEVRQLSFNVLKSLKISALESFVDYARPSLEELGIDTDSRAENRTEEEEVLAELKNTTGMVEWLQALNGLEASASRVEITIQIARGIQMKVPMLRSALTDPELKEPAYRYLASWAYNLSIIYGTSFVAIGAEGEPDLINVSEVKALLTRPAANGFFARLGMSFLKVIHHVLTFFRINSLRRFFPEPGALSNVRESLQKGEDNPLGIQNYSNAGHPVVFKALSELTSQEKEEKPVVMNAVLRTDAKGVYAGIDIGGGSAKIIILKDGHVLELPEALRSLPTVPYGEDGKALLETPQQYVARLAGHMKKIQGYLKATYGIEKIDGVGMDSPGAADFETNSMKTLGQISVKKGWNQKGVEWAGKKLPLMVASALGLDPNQVKIRNDMDGVLPGVASVLAQANPAFWELSKGNFAFAWKGSGYGFQFSVNGVPMNAPTEAGHMIFDFRRPGEKVFDTESYTSIPSMLHYARTMAQEEGVSWPEIEGDALKPMADAAFDEDENAKSEIAKASLKRFADKFASNLAMLHIMSQRTGKGTVANVLLGGGVARGKTGKYLKFLTAAALQSYGLTDQIAITVIDEDDIRKAGVDPDTIGALGSAYFIQSVLAARYESRQDPDAEKPPFNVLELNSEVENQRGAIPAAVSYMDLFHELGRNGFPLVDGKGNQLSWTADIASKIVRRKQLLEYRPEILGSLRHPILGYNLLVKQKPRSVGALSYAVQDIESVEDPAEVVKYMADIAVDKKAHPDFQVYLSSRSFPAFMEVEPGEQKNEARVTAILIAGLSAEHGLMRFEIMTGEPGSRAAKPLGIKLQSPSEKPVLTAQFENGKLVVRDSDEVGQFLERVSRDHAIFLRRTFLPLPSRNEAREESGKVTRNRSENREEGWASAYINRDLVMELAKIEHPSISKFRINPETQEAEVLYVKGPRMSDWIQRHARGDKEAFEKQIMEWMLQIADALEVLHARGIPHGDIKADNVVIGESNRAVLVDFGDPYVSDVYMLHAFYDMAMMQRQAQIYPLKPGEFSIPILELAAAARAESDPLWLNIEALLKEMLRLLPVSTLKSVIELYYTRRWASENQPKIPDADFVSALQGIILAGIQQGLLTLEQRLAQQGMEEDEGGSSPRSESRDEEDRREMAKRQLAWRLWQGSNPQRNPPFFRAEILLPDWNSLPREWSSHHWNLASHSLEDGAILAPEIPVELRVDRLAQALYEAKRGPAAIFDIQAPEAVERDQAIASVILEDVSRFFSQDLADPNSAVNFIFDSTQLNRGPLPVHDLARLNNRGIFYHHEQQYAEQQRASGVSSIKGGDWFRVSTTKNGRYALLEIADGMGHGPSAMPAEMFRDAVHFYELRKGTLLTQILKRFEGSERDQYIYDYLSFLGKTIQSRSENPSGFYTYSLALVDYKNGTVHEWGGGHHLAALQVLGEEKSGWLPYQRGTEGTAPIGSFFPSPYGPANRGAVYRKTGNSDTRVSQVVLYTDGAYQPATKGDLGIHDAALNRSAVQNLRGPQLLNALRELSVLKGTDDITILVADLRQGFEAYLQSGVPETVKENHLTGIRSEMREVNLKNQPVLLLPGTQIASKSKVGEMLYQNEPAFRRVFDRAAEFYRSENFDLIKHAFQDTPDQLNRLENSQPVQVVMTYALMEMLKEKLGPEFKPGAFAGSSTNQITALMAAGSLSFEDGLRLALAQGKNLQAFADKKEGDIGYVIGLTESEIQALAEKHHVFTSIFGNTNFHNLSGPRENMAAAIAEAKANDKVTSAKVLSEIGTPSHSEAMADIKETMKQAVQALTIHAPETPVIGGSTGGYLWTEDQVRQELEDMLIKPVLWRQAMDRLRADGAEISVELGTLNKRPYLIEHSNANQYFFSPLQASSGFQGELSRFQTAIRHENRMTPEEVTEARQVTFLGLHRKLLGIFSQYKAAQKRKDTDRQEKLLARAKQMSVFLDPYIAEILPASGTERVELDFLNRFRHSQKKSDAAFLKEQSQTLYGDVAEYTRLFVNAYQKYQAQDAKVSKSAAEELDKLNFHVVNLLKRRLKMQLIRLQNELEAEKMNQAVVFMLLVSVNDLYHRLAYEHFWRASRKSGRGETYSRFVTVDPAGYVTETYDYERQPLLRIQVAQEDVEVSQIMWRQIEVEQGVKALEPVMTPLSFEDVPAAYRSRTHAIDSQHQDLVHLKYHDYGLRGIEDTLTYYERTWEAVPEDIRESLTATLKSILDGNQGRYGLGRRIKRYTDNGSKTGKAIPMPQDSLKLALIHIANGESKQAQEQIEAARQWVEKRREDIQDRTLPATERKRDYLYLMMRDQAVLSTLQSFKTWLQKRVPGLPDEEAVREFQSIYQRLEALDQTYFGFSVKSSRTNEEIAQYKVWQTEVHYWMGVLRGLNGALSRKQEKMFNANVQGIQRNSRLQKNIDQVNAAMSARREALNPRAENREDDDEEAADEEPILKIEDFRRAFGIAEAETKSHPFPEFPRMEVYVAGDHDFQVLVYRDKDHQDNKFKNAIFIDVRSGIAGDEDPDFLPQVRVRLPEAPAKHPIHKVWPLVQQKLEELIQEAAGRGHTVPLLINPEDEEEESDEGLEEAASLHVEDVRDQFQGAFKIAHHYLNHPPQMIIATGSSAVTTMAFHLVAIQRLQPALPQNAVPPFIWLFPETNEIIHKRIVSQVAQLRNMADLPGRVIPQDILEQAEALAEEQAREHREEYLNLIAEDILLLYPDLSLAQAREWLETLMSQRLAVIDDISRTGMKYYVFKGAFKGLGFQNVEFAYQIASGNFMSRNPSHILVGKVIENDEKVGRLLATAKTNRWIGSEGPEQLLENFEIAPLMMENMLSQIEIPDDLTPESMKRHETRSTYMESLKRVNPDYKLKKKGEEPSYTKPFRHPALYKEIINYKESHAGPLSVAILGPGLRLENSVSYQTTEVAALLNDRQVDFTLVGNDPELLQLASQPRIYPRDAFLSIQNVSLKQAIEALSASKNAAGDFVLDPSGIKNPIHVFAANFQEIQYGKEELDIVIATQSLLYAFNSLPEHERLPLLVRVLSALKPGGELYLDNDVLPSLTHRDTERTLSDTEEQKAAWELKERLEESGMEVYVSIDENTLEIARSESRTLDKSHAENSLRNEARTEEKLPNVKSELKVASEVTARILSLNRIKGLFDLLFPKAYAAETYQSMTLEEKRRLTEIYTAFFENGGKAVLPAAIFADLADDVLADYFEPVLEAAKNSQSGASSLIIAGNGQDFVKKYLFSKRFVGLYPSLSLIASRFIELTPLPEEAKVAQIKEAGAAVSFFKAPLAENWQAARVPALMWDTEALSKLSPAEKLQALHRMTQLQFLIAEQLKNQPGDRLKLVGELLGKLGIQYTPGILGLPQPELSSLLSETVGRMLSAELASKSA